MSDVFSAQLSFQLLLIISILSLIIYIYRDFVIPLSLRKTSETDSAEIANPTLEPTGSNLPKYAQSNQTSVEDPNTTSNQNKTAQNLSTHHIAAGSKASVSIDITTTEDVGDAGDNATTPLSPTLRNLQNNNASKTANIAAKFGGTAKKKPPMKVEFPVSRPRSKAQITQKTSTNHNKTASWIKQNKNESLDTLEPLQINGNKQSKSVPTTPAKNETSKQDVGDNDENKNNNNNNINNIKNTGNNLKINKKNQKIMSKTPEVSNSKNASWRKKELPKTPISKRPLPPSTRHHQTATKAPITKPKRHLFKRSESSTFIDAALLNLDGVTPSPSVSPIPSHSPMGVSTGLPSPFPNTGRNGNNGNGNGNAKGKGSNYIKTFGVSSSTTSGNSMNTSIGTSGNTSGSGGSSSRSGTATPTVGGRHHRQRSSKKFKKRTSTKSSLGIAINLMDLFDMDMKVNVWDEKKSAWIVGKIIDMGDGRNNNNKDKAGDENVQIRKQTEQVITVQSLKNKFIKIKVNLLEHPEFIEVWNENNDDNNDNENETKNEIDKFGNITPKESNNGKSKGFIKLVKNRSQIKPPTDMVTFMSNQSRKKMLTARPLPSLPKFGTPVSKQKCIKVDGYDTPIPDIVDALKKKFDQFNGEFCQGIFCNGEVTLERCKMSPTFMSGVIKQNIIEECVVRIEKNSIESLTYFESEESYSALLYSELIKKWLVKLPTPLLQQMPPFYFNNFNNCNAEQLGTYIKQIEEPHRSVLMFLFDICASVANNSDKNGLNIEMLAYVFAPYLFYYKDESKYVSVEQKIVEFCKLGIEWRMKHKN